MDRSIILFITSKGAVYPGSHPEAERILRQINRIERSEVDAEWELNWNIFYILAAQTTPAPDWYIKYTFSTKEDYEKAWDFYDKQGDYWSYAEEAPVVYKGSELESMYAEGCKIWSDIVGENAVDIEVESSDDEPYY